MANSRSGPGFLGRLYGASAEAAGDVLGRKFVSKEFVARAIKFSESLGANDIDKLANVAKAIAIFLTGLISSDILGEGGEGFFVSIINEIQRRKNELPEDEDQQRQWIKTIAESEAQKNLRKPAEKSASKKTFFEAIAGLSSDTDREKIRQDLASFSDEEETKMLLQGMKPNFTVEGLQGLLALDAKTRRAALMVLLSPEAVKKDPTTIEKLGQQVLALIGPHQDTPEEAAARAGRETAAKQNAVEAAALNAVLTYCPEFTKDEQGNPIKPQTRRERLWLRLKQFVHELIGA
ncbi:MAG TPA: hypothetical protein VFQ60_05000 [Patescibacteria group bacterium]|nr:hypothetical protein [Patescibacteria group bacterium]